MTRRETLHCISVKFRRHERDLFGMNFDKHKRTVKLGGKTRGQATRDELVDQAREQRHQREHTRHRLHAATCIQRWYRSAPAPRYLQGAVCPWSSQLTPSPPGTSDVGSTTSLSWPVQGYTSATTAARGSQSLLAASVGTCSCGSTAAAAGQRARRYSDRMHVPALPTAAWHHHDPGLVQLSCMLCRLRAAAGLGSVPPSSPQPASPRPRARRPLTAVCEPDRRGSPARRACSAPPQCRDPGPGAQLLQPGGRRRPVGHVALALPVPASAAVLRRAAGRGGSGVPNGPPAAGGRCEDRGCAAG